MSNPNMAYITNIKYDDVTQRFLTNIMKTVSDSLAEPKQPNVTTTTPMSNSSAATAQNPLHGILNAAFNFNGSTDTANSLGPVADIIMETINMLAPQPTATPKKESCVKKAEQTKPTMQASNCSATLAQNNTTALPKCPYAADSKLIELSNKLSVLREQIIELPGGDKYLKTIDEQHDAILYQLMMQNYEKMLVFRENLALSGSIASIVQKLQPKVILPANAKKALATSVNSAQIAKPITDIYDTISLTKPDYTKLETVVATWLSENTGMYVIV